MPRHPLIPVSCLAALLLGACATSPDSGRVRLTAPRELTVLHSEVQAQAQLALKPASSCEAQACDAAEAFREQVLQLGRKLEPAARQLADELKFEAPVFDLSVSDTGEIGTLSSASGKVVVFAGLRELAIPEAALAFLIAREMGHVMAGHHEENSSTSLVVSLAIAVLFPMAGLLHGVETTYATTMAGSLTSTAASFAGTRVIQGLYREDQRREADVLALRILVRAGWSPQEVSDALKTVQLQEDSDGWLEELRATTAWLGTITARTPAQEPEAEELAESSMPAAAGRPDEQLGPAQPPVRHVAPPAVVKKFAGNQPAHLKHSQRNCRARSGGGKPACSAPVGRPKSPLSHKQGRRRR